MTPKHINNITISAKPQLNRTTVSTKFQKPFLSFTQNSIRIMSAEYVKYLVDNKERINQEHKMYAEFWMRENVRIHEEFPELSSIEKVSKLADEWRSYTETPEYKALLESQLVNAD